MEQFDKKVYNKADNDNRGFKDVLDIGFGHNGAMRDCINDQALSSKYICAKPTLINLKGNEKEYMHMGKMLDCIQLFMDAEETHLRDGGRKLFSSEKRRMEFVMKLRKATGAKIFRGEAVTILRQLVGRMNDLSMGKINFNQTMRHT